jgi:hypothetical protein
MFGFAVCEGKNNEGRRLYIQPSPGAHPASSTRVLGLFPGGKAAGT